METRDETMPAGRRGPSTLVSALAVLIAIAAVAGLAIATRPPAPQPGPGLLAGAVPSASPGGEAVAASGLPAMADASATPGLLPVAWPPMPVPPWRGPVQWVVGADGSLGPSRFVILPAETPEAVAGPAAPAQRHFNWWAGGPGHFFRR